MARLRFNVTRVDSYHPDQISISARAIRGLCYAVIGQLGMYPPTQPHAIEFGFDAEADAQRALLEITSIFEQMGSTSDPGICVSVNWPELTVGGVTWDVKLIGE